MKEKISALTVIITLLFVAGAVFGYRVHREPMGFVPGDKVINLTGYGKCGVWTTEDINGLNYWWKEFEAAVIYLEKDDNVVLRLSSADLMHQFYSPGVGIGPVDVKPGHVVEVRFTADRTGVFQYYCTSICGCCHFYMRGWIVVSDRQAKPIKPPPILCPLCLPEFGPPPEGSDLVTWGNYLYQEKGCSTCHGFEGRGGIKNENCTIEAPPAHNQTAEKFFLQDPDEAEAFIALLQENPGLNNVKRSDDISRFQLVETRYNMALELILNGKYSEKLDPAGPEPPLQMPAWQYILTDHEIDSLLAYFVSLMPWDEDEEEEEFEYEEVALQ